MDAIDLEVFLDDPGFSGQELSWLETCLREGQVSTRGRLVPQFETALARMLDTEDSLAVRSGSQALHLILHQLGVGPGDEVILPSLTFVATAHPVALVGARPVLVDVDPESWVLDVDAVAAAITSRTKAVIAVHLYGNPCPMEALTALCRSRGLYLIEDASQALGSRLAGRPMGTWGDAGFFSFNGNKLITTGGGGLIVCRSQKRLARLRVLANQGRDERQVPCAVGFNGAMTNLEAALALLPVT